MTHDPNGRINAVSDADCRAKELLTGGAWPKFGIDQRKNVNRLCDAPHMTKSGGMCAGLFVRSRTAIDAARVPRIS
jgi:hypothetical protein